MFFQPKLTYNYAWLTSYFCPFIVALLLFPSWGLLRPPPLSGVFDFAPPRKPAGLSTECRKSASSHLNPIHLKYRSPVRTINHFHIPLISLENNRVCTRAVNTAKKRYWKWICINKNSLFRNFKVSLTNINILYDIDASRFMAVFLFFFLFMTLLVPLAVLCSERLRW